MTGIQARWRLAGGHEPDLLTTFDQVDRFIDELIGLTCSAAMLTLHPSVRPFSAIPDLSMIVGLRGKEFGSVQGVREAGEVETNEWVRCRARRSHQETALRISTCPRHTAKAWCASRSITGGAPFC